MRKGLNESINEGVLWWFGHKERMERDRITKRVYVGEFTGNRSVSRPRKRWTDTMKEAWMSGKQGEWPRIEVNATGEAWGINS